MASTTESETQTCAFCGRAVRDCLDVERFNTHVCLSCSTRLGRLLVDAPDAFVSVWPSLLEKEDPDEPEPKLRMPDGSSVEVRSRTAELKKELTVEARVQLAATYGDLGLNREQLLECATVLSLEPPRPLAQAVMKILMTHKFTAPDAIERLRLTLFPV